MNRVSKDSRFVFASQKYASLLFVIIFAVSLVAIQLVRVDLDPLDNLVSNYGVGWTRWIFTASLSCLAIAKFILIERLNIRFEGNLKNTLVSFLAISAVTTIFVAFFQTDIRPPTTIVGVIHTINAVTSFLATGVFLVLFTFFKYKGARTTRAVLPRIIIFVPYLILLVVYPFIDYTTKTIVERLLIINLSIGIGYYATRYT